MLLRGAFLSACLVGWSGLILGNPGLAQSINPKLAADEVYRQVPDLPQENQYSRKKGDKPATNNTLVSRFIQYHTLVKGRSPQYRFDWKITLADYLGMHENIREETYPGHAFLKTNPMKGDRKLIQQLTRQQRLALTQTLSDLYASQAQQQEAATPEETSVPQDPPANNNVPESKPSEPAGAVEPAARPKLTPLPGSGGADLLRGPAPQSIPSQSTPQPASSPINQQPSGDTQKLSF